MKHFLRPYRKVRITLAFVGATAALALVPHLAHAQAQEMSPMFEDPSPFAVRASAAGYLGVDIEDIDTDKAQALKLKEVRGAVITLIDHDAPAGQIGLTSMAGPTRKGPDSPSETAGPGPERSSGDGAGQTAAGCSSNSAVSPLVRLGSTWMPGPIVEVIATFLTYLPLAAAGLSRMTSSMAAA